MNYIVQPNKQSKDIKENCKANCAGNCIAKCTNLGKCFCPIK